MLDNLEQYKYKIINIEISHKVFPNVEQLLMAFSADNISNDNTFTFV